MMMVDGKKITPVYGNMRPMEVRVNNQRVAGWVNESQSGKSVSFENTYNYEADVVVHGNSVQNGEPSLDAPIPVLSAGGNLLVNDEPVLPLPPLRKIGDIADSYNPKTGEYTQRIGKKVFDGTENWLTSGDSGFAEGYYGYVLIFSSALKSSPILCSHFPNYSVEQKNKLSFSNTSAEYNFRVTVKDIATVQTWKAYLTVFYNVDNPVTVYYQLAEPIITYLNPAIVPTYYPYTHIEQDGVVKGIIEATVKVVE